MLMPAGFELGGWHIPERFEEATVEPADPIPASRTRVRVEVRGERRVGDDVGRSTAMLAASIARSTSATLPLPSVTKIDDSASTRRRRCATPDGLGRVQVVVGLGERVGVGVADVACDDGNVWRHIDPLRSFSLRWAAA
jgi:hypothetical protein